MSMRDDARVNLAEETSASVAAKEYKQSSNVKSDKMQMHVKVYSPFKDYYDGTAFSISAENLTGPFDILPKHHSFISLLLPCDILIRTPTNDTNAPIKIRITGGLIHVKEDNVIVFLDV